MRTRFDQLVSHLQTFASECAADEMGVSLWFTSEQPDGVARLTVRIEHQHTEDILVHLKCRISIPHGPRYTLVRSVQWVISRGSMSTSVLVWHPLLRSVEWSELRLTIRLVESIIESTWSEG